MVNRLMKIAFAVTCLTLLSVPLSAQKGRGGGGSGGSTGCAVVSTPTVSAVTASPGMDVGVFGRVSNCATGKKRYTVTVSSMSACGEETMIASSIISFAGGEAKLISVAYPIAPDTCLGSMTISVKVYDGGTMLGGESTGITIQ